MKPLTLEDIAARIISLEALFVEKVRQGARIEAVAMLLLSRVGDPTRLTVKEAAALEEKLLGKGSVASVRSKIRAGKYHLQKRDGEKEARIPVEEVYGDYLPIDDWRALLEATKRGSRERGRG